MQTAHTQFLNNITYIHELDSLYHFLKHTQKLPNDLSDLLRAEIVYAVSALDKLVHELVKIGMIETFSGNRAATDAFEGFTISAKTLHKIKETAIERSKNQNAIPLPEELPEYWFNEEIVVKHKAVSYQDPSKIGAGLSLIWKETHKWQKIAPLMGYTDKQGEGQVKKQLELIVERRNQIVHEADINVQTGLRNIIDYIDAKESVDFIARLGTVIFNLVK
jgi:RiboL-PSP-HEPN